MDSYNCIFEKLKLEKEISMLQSQLENKKKALQNLLENKSNHTLSNRDIVRYSRQIIVPNIGVKGQEKIKKSSVLIVGCGGLGCPAAQYLVGCGVGRIGLVDYDIVEENNLHRQLLYSEENIGISKVQSASLALKKLNREVIIDEYIVQLDSSNALNIISQYDIIIDASDNVATRYLVNDSCILCKKPLVSGSAVRTEGQLTVFNYKCGPCYRCIFPKPPPPETVTNCGDAGVLGPIPGTIGVLQALQVIYIILESDNVLSRKLLLFDGNETYFKTVKLRGRDKSCNICGDNPSITKLTDYEQFCGAPATDKVLSLNLLNSSERVTAEELLSQMMSDTPPILVDVRSPIEFQICNLPGSVNIPLSNLSKPENQILLENKIKENDTKTICIVCKRGNDSQIGVKNLQEKFITLPLYDLKGGLYAWAEIIDNSFPIY